MSADEIRALNPSIFTGREDIAGAALLAIAVLLGMLASLPSLLGRSRVSGGSADPWHGHTLEWATTSPPPYDNFEVAPAGIASPWPHLDAETSENEAAETEEREG